MRSSGGVLRWRRLAWLGVALLGGASCRQVIGIEDAELAPATLGGAGGNGAVSSAQNTGGTSVVAIGGVPEAGNANVSLPLEPQGGSADAGGQSSAGGSGGAAGDAAGPSVCDEYCTAVMASCTGTFAVYTSLDACLSVCAALPEGKPGDRNVDSVQCRLHAALIAADEVPHYCPIAGPGGNGECGSNCESLCGLRENICATYKSGDLATCQQTCAKLSDLGTYSTDLNVGQYSGPHVQCRLYHVSAAAADDPEQHCLHVDGAAPCK